MSAKMTPMLQQYMEIKREYADCILFFRLGDFYEMFMEDAVTASRELEIVLTGRDSGAQRLPMCGIPYHAASGYLAKLLQKGYKVAICEQVEDPKIAKGIVKREVVRVVTPGTVLEDQLLKEKANNFLAALSCTNDAIGLAYIDLSTGEFRTTQLKRRETTILATEMIRISPAELLITAEDHHVLQGIFSVKETMVTHGKSSEFQLENAYQALTRHFGLQSLRSFGCEESPAAIQSCGALLSYLMATQKNSLQHLCKIISYLPGEFMVLDATARRNLELTRTIRDGELHGSLLGVLDMTVTAMGGRLLRSWVEQPLGRLEPILQRQKAISRLASELELRERLRENLQKTYDLQRILAKLATGSANARDLLGLCNSLTQIPELKKCLAGLKEGRLKSIGPGLELLPQLTTLLQTALVENPPLTIREGGMIQPSFHPELEKFINAASHGKRQVAAMEHDERKRTGIKSLKIGFNQVFGYYIEVTNTNLSAIPTDYIRKQTLTNGERFINQALKEFEDLILNAHEKSIALESQIFQELRETVLKEIEHLQSNALLLAELDALLALAETAIRYHYAAPTFNTEGRLLLLDSRHPVVERMLPGGAFVPNDALMDGVDNRTMIITGPNMAGKSTYMRQVALIVLLAHVGAFVPARLAEIPLIDRVFARVGASDDLATGASTFMVEMNEVAYILNHATANSLIILDELGRGTSTFDGLSIAWAVLEFINNLKRIGAKTMIATHYHELTDLEHRLQGVKNFHVAVAREGEEITFLRRIQPGHTSQSYGIEVARLAGLPEEITARARIILQALEGNETNEMVAIQKSPPEPSPPQLPLFALEFDAILEDMRMLDLSATTPLEALNRLYEWQQKLRNVS
jgi:DNA mismatch repair protein MutS